MSAELPDDRPEDPPLDAPLRAALAHAPDRALRPPTAVREAVLRAAHAAVPARTPAWQRWLGLDRGWDSPRLWTAVAGVAGVGLALNLAWHVSTSPEASSDAERVDAVPMAATPAVSEAAATAKVAEAAAADEPLPRDLRQRQDEVSRQSPAPRTTEERKVASPPPRIAATNAVPPPAPVPAAAPSPAPTAPAPAAPQQAEAAAPARTAPGLAAERRMEDAAPPAAKAARGALAGQAMAPLGQGVVNPWPSPLARLAPLLGADGDWPAAGWHVTGPVGAAAPSKAWWQALLQGTAGRWQAEPGPVPAETPAAPAWQVTAPDGGHFTLTLAGGAAWLQAGGAAWRAAPVPPLP